MSFNNPFGRTAGPDKPIEELKAELAELKRRLDLTADVREKIKLQRQIEDLVAAISLEELIAKVPEGTALKAARNDLGQAFSLLSAQPNLALAILGIIEVAIEHGAPIYNAGSHIGCASIYDYAARMILRLLDSPAAAEPYLGQVEAKLRMVSFDPITEQEANKRAWELRRAFDFTLALLIPTLSEPSASQKLRVFVSYSHKDEVLRAELDNHLAPLRREYSILEWHDGKVLAGGDWRREVKQNLESAHIILLLVSASYLASEFCVSVEMMRAIERHNMGTAVVIPIILKPADWSGAPFGNLKALPKDGIPVSKWRDPDEAFMDAATGIRRVIETLLKHEPRAQP
jgi:hypothetical protein